MSSGYTLPPSTFPFLVALADDDYRRQIASVDVDTALSSGRRSCRSEPFS